MVSQAWDLAAIEEHYEQFIEEFGGRGRDDVLARQIELVHAWRGSRPSTRRCPASCCRTGGAG